MNYRYWRITLATIIATAFIVFSVYGASPPSYSILEFTGGSTSHITLVAKRAKKSRSASSPISISNIRFHAHKTYTRVVLDLPGQRTVSESKDPKRQRTTLQLKKARLSKKARNRLKHKKFPPGIKIIEGSNKTVSVTLDLAMVDKYKLHTLRRPYRVVVDLYYSQKPKRAPNSVTKRQSAKNSLAKGATQSAKGKTPTSSPATPSSPVSPPLSVPAPIKSFKDLLVVIDPGHGGRDPGAIGAKGTREKVVTLKIAKALQDIIQRRLGTAVLLTRSSDVFLNLENRVAFANNKKADVFISIHVNSHSVKSIKGLEVYHFGKASDPRALQVAARENGITLAEDTPPWQFIIADKLNDQKIEESQTFAWTTRQSLLRTLKKNYSIKDHGVKTAPFYVLRFTTMPSILTEVAFVSNASEEKRLRSKKYQKKVAEGMYKGIHAYLKSLYPGIV